MKSDRCIICGEIVPEGRQVCPVCECSFMTKRRTIEANVTLQNGKTIFIVANDHKELAEKLDKMNWKKVEQI